MNNVNIRKLPIVINIYNGSRENEYIVTFSGKNLRCEYVGYRFLIQKNLCSFFGPEGSFDIHYTTFNGSLGLIIDWFSKYMSKHYVDKFAGEYSYRPNYNKDIYLESEEYELLKNNSYSSKLEIPELWTMCTENQVIKKSLEGEKFIKKSRESEEELLEDDASIRFSLLELR